MIVILAAAVQAFSSPTITPDNVAQAVQSALPQVCDVPPAPDAPIGTAGSGAPCTPRIDAARQTVVPPSSAITASDGSFSGTWKNTAGQDIVLSSAPTRGIATIYGSVIAYHCQLSSMTTTGYTGKCWQIVSSTLPTIATSLLGLVVSPIANAAAGQTVNVFARQ